MTHEQSYLLNIRNHALNYQRQNGQIAGAEKAGAEFLFGRNGVHPYYWGVSREQFSEFIDEVRKKWKDENIKNVYGNDPSHKFYYSNDIFNDPTRGPNMHTSSSR